MIVQFIRLESIHPEAELLTVAKERMPQFQALPGLIQKYYAKSDKPNQYCGIYIWDSMESLSAFRESELAATIPSAYKLAGKPEVEIMEGLFALRDLS